MHITLTIFYWRCHQSIRYTFSSLSLFRYHSYQAVNKKFEGKKLEQHPELRRKLIIKKQEITRTRITTKQLTSAKSTYSQHKKPSISIVYSSSILYYSNIISKRRKFKITTYALVQLWIYIDSDFRIGYPSHIKRQVPYQFSM